MKIGNPRLIVIAVFIFVLASCGPQTVSQPDATPTTQSPTATQAVQASATTTATALPLPTVQKNCTDSALYVEDVSIPDNTHLKPGEKFTKIWRLRNTGTCIWNVRYALIFVGGDQMDAAVTTPLSETPPGATLDISVDLLAPAKDGQYTGLYEVRNPTGRALAIGAVTSIWVKILVGNASILPVSTPAPAAAGQNQGAAAMAPPNKACHAQQNDGFTGQILALINKARADAKLAGLTLNGQLTAAAQGHSNDMACNNFADHTGSDGSSIHARVVAAGYAPSYSEEIIFPGGMPQDAFNWWINDSIHRAAILNTKVVDVGGGLQLPGGQCLWRLLHG